MTALTDMPISFPGLFGSWEFNSDPIAIHVGHGIYWYGGIGHHGGGAFSGKDATKVDRSATYMARHSSTCFRIRRNVMSEFFEKLAKVFLVFSAVIGVLLLGVAVCKRIESNSV